MMDTVYGNHVHQNAGQHLPVLIDDISNNEKWQDHWRRLIFFPSQMSDFHSGAGGKDFLDMCQTRSKA